MKRIYSAPKLENSVITLQAQIFHKMGLGFLITIVFSLSIDIIVSNQNVNHWILLISLFSIVGTLLLYSNKQGLARFAQFGFILLCFSLFFHCYGFRAV
jgi:hypothetical protein